MFHGIELATRLSEDVGMSGPFQIVLVEDAESDVFLIREALQQADLAFELHVVDDGEKALEFIANAENDETVPLPHLMILDLNLPRVSGRQILERVRQSPRCNTIPVLILTSSDSPKDEPKSPGSVRRSTFESLPSSTSS